MRHQVVHHQAVHHLPVRGRDKVWRPLNSVHEPVCDSHASAFNCSISRSCLQQLGSCTAVPLGSRTGTSTLVNSNDDVCIVWSPSRGPLPCLFTVTLVARSLTCSPGGPHRPSGATVPGLDHPERGAVPPLTVH